MNVNPFYSNSFSPLKMDSPWIDANFKCQADSPPPSFPHIKIH